MDQLSNMWNSLAGMLPSVIGGIVLILVAWLVATLVRSGFRKGLTAMNLDERLEKWGAVQSADQGRSMIDTVSKVLYYLVWVLFLPGIFETFGLTSVSAPIQNMLNTALGFLPNLIGAIVLGAIALIVGKFVKNLVYNLALSINVDRWISKLTAQTGKTDASEGVSREQKDTIANVLANIAYVIVLIPILVVALETLGIRSISEPIVNVLNSILAAIPNILVAVILLGVGMAIAKFVGDLVSNLLQGTGINKLTDNMNVKGAQKLDLAQISGQVVAVLIGLFFFVEALNALNLAVLNTIGTAIIAYLPNVVFAIIILGLGVIGGQWIAGLISQSTGSKWAGQLVQYVLIAFALFMVLDQLNFASNIVNTAFIFIIGGLSVAFALSFGLGGRDFARKQLEKLDNKVDEESNKPNNQSSNNNAN
jgi:hypothetical protein